MFPINKTRYLKIPETWKRTSTSLKGDGEAEKALVEGHTFSDFVH